MKKFDTLFFLRDEHKEKALQLNAIQRTKLTQIVNKNNPLLLEGFLQVVESKNKTQTAFIDQNMTAVSLSKKGKAFLDMAMKTIYF